MVEYSTGLDTVFASLADPTRRDILRQISERELTIGQVAKRYDMSLAAVSKHLQILEQAKLITKRRRGKERIVSLRPETMAEATEYLKRYEQQWVERFDRLEHHLKDAEE